jgi:transcriptional regulator GlxA family with amidase domain
MLLKEDIAMRTVGIAIFDDVEVLDACGPFEVFSVARPVGVRDDDQRLFQPITIAQTTQPVTCVGGLRIVPEATFGAHPPLDIVIIPGGRGARLVQRDNPVILDWIATQSARVEILASVCTGAFLLAERGLLDGKRATTHWASVATLREQFPQVRVLDDVRYVDEGRILTSAGISAGIDMSLYLVARLHSVEVAMWTARRMEYGWSPPPSIQG